jgi:hypothetical protein
MLVLEHGECGCWSVALVPQVLAMVSVFQTCLSLLLSPLPLSDIVSFPQSQGLFSLASYYSEWDTERKLLWTALIIFLMCVCFFFFAMKTFLSKVLRLWSWYFVQKFQSSTFLLYSLWQFNRYIKQEIFNSLGLNIGILWLNWCCYEFL